MMDPSSVEDFYNALTNPQANGGAGLPTQDPQATLASALNAPPPTVQMPQRDQPDMSMLPSLSLLRLAASLSQRRYNGQSRLGQLTAGLADAGDFAMNQKKQLVDQSNEKYRQDVLAAGTQANIAATNAQAEATRTKTAVEKASAPLNMTGLSIAIDTARDEGQLKKLQVKLSTIASNYAAQKAQAELDLQAAQTDKARADAQAALSNATANLQTAQAHLQTAQAHMGRLTLERDMFEEGKRQGSFKTTANLPGEPSTFQYTDTRGNVMVGTMPIDQPQAIKKAKDDWKQVKDLPDYKNMTQDQYIQQRVQSLTNPPTWNAAINDMQSRKNAANGVAPTGVNMPPPAGVPGAVPPPTAPAALPSTPAAVAGSAQLAAIEYSKSQPGKVTVFNGNGSGTPVYYMNGQEMSPEQVSSIQGRMTPSAPGAPAANPGTPAPVKPTVAPAAAVSTGPEAAPSYSGQYARERQALHQQINDLLFQIKQNPNMPDQDRLSIANKVGALQSRLNTLSGLK
jgi:hypothetical protein